MGVLGYLAKGLDFTLEKNGEITKALRVGSNVLKALLSWRELWLTVTISAGT